MSTNKEHSLTLLLTLFFEVFEFSLADSSSWRRGLRTDATASERGPNTHTSKS
jgi:hypothetical protein